MTEQTETTNGNWSPSSWRNHTAAQQPNYPDSAALDNTVDELSKLPPLVTSWEVETLKSELAEASRGERFLLQGGDCSESFTDCESNTITCKLKILLQMGLVLAQGARRPVIRLGRIAGQYAKPRSSDTENVNGQTLPTYRGDMINGASATPEARIPDPQRLLRAYGRSALTLNFIRSLTYGGFADLHHPENWDLAFMTGSPRAADFTRRVHNIAESRSFVETISGQSIPEITRVEFFTSHEGLHLPYEQAQTRIVPRRTGYYNLSTHFPWIGERTRELGGAHIEFFRGIANPIGIKLGPKVTGEDALALCDVLNPDNEPGRLTFIHRFGAEKVEECLPKLVEAIRREGREIVWCCDPMHGNTQTTADGIKTRHFDNIQKELETSFRVLRECGTHLGGMHVELTGENVTECIGGAGGLTEEGLAKDYRSSVDPRLNYEQAMELSLHLAHLMAESRE